MGCLTRYGEPHHSIDGLPTWERRTYGLGGVGLQLACPPVGTAVAGPACSSVRTWFGDRPGSDPSSCLCCYGTQVAQEVHYNQAPACQFAPALASSHRPRRFIQPFLLHPKRASLVHLCCVSCRVKFYSSSESKHRADSHGEQAQASATKGRVAESNRHKQAPPGPWRA